MIEKDKIPAAAVDSAGLLWLSFLGRRLGDRVTLVAPEAGVAEVSAIRRRAPLHQVGERRLRGGVGGRKIAMSSGADIGGSGASQRALDKQNIAAVGGSSGRSLRILFTNNTLAYRAGSELFVFDLAVALRKRGHQPIAFSTVLGEVADQLRSAAVPVIDDLGALSVTPDIIHGQHHLELATALLRFPNTPAIHVCHGWLPWEEEPLRFPTIQKYIAVSNLTRERLLTSGIPTNSIEVVHNFVDTDRFKPRDRLPSRPKTAAVFSNYISCEHPHFLAIAAACRQLEFEKIDLFGSTAGSALSKPEEVLPSYDVTFAAGRCALEALACGCAVIVGDHHGLGGLVTPANLEYFRRGNFGIATTYGNRVTAAKVIAEIVKLDPSNVEAASRMVRTEAALLSAAANWERIYHDAMNSLKAPSRLDRVTSAGSDYLRKLNPVVKNRYGEWNSLLSKRAEDAHRIAGLEESLVEKERNGAALKVILDERSTLLAEAQSRIAALEASVAEAEGRSATLGATLEERTTQLQRARLEITGLEASVTEAEGRSATLGATLDERTAQLQEARLEITGLEVSAAEAIARIAALTASLAESAGQLSEAQGRISALEASVKEEEQRGAERDAALDARATELTAARDRAAALETSLAERDRDLSHYRQRIAEIKASLSWRLTAPFREMQRPIGRLQASRLGIKLTAALRHPRNPAKRKVYRARHNTGCGASSVGDPKYGSPFRVKLGALVRHPFSSQGRKLYRERVQSRRFGTAPLDSMEPRSDAHRHKMPQPPEPDAGGFRGRILETLRPFEETIAAWQSVPRVKRELHRHSLFDLLDRSVPPGSVCVISFSQDNYRAIVGGIQLCVQIEEAAFKRRNAAYLHLSPSQPLPTLAPDTPASDYKFSLSLNGELHGQVAACELLDALTLQEARGVRHELVVHSLLGHSPELVTELCRAAGIRQGIYWVHDYFSLCPNYTLMRNSVSYCGAPPPSSPACQICHVGSHRMAHLRRMRGLFSQIAFTVAAPSASALAVWQAGADFPVQRTLVHEHCRLQTEGAAAPATAGTSPVTSPLRVAFLGFPTIQKGWPVFCDAVRLCDGDTRYTFYHLGKAASKAAPAAIRFLQTEATTTDWRALSKAVSQNRIDVAFLCSLCRETYNFTSLEALAGGALIVTLAGSGNIAALVKKYGCGLTFENETALKYAFATGSLVTKIRDMQNTGSSQYTYTFSDMTAELLSVGAAAE